MFMEPTSSLHREVLGSGRGGPDGVRVTATLTIGEAAARSGASTKMIRSYESIGLVPAPLRKGTGYRVYALEDVRILSFIHRARAFGFPIERIRALVCLWQGKEASREVKAIAMQQVEDLSVRIQALQHIAAALVDLAARCPGDGASECPTLSDLAGNDLQSEADGEDLKRSN
jgi:MerR family copper efflux transcriptional regulator